MLGFVLGMGGRDVGSCPPRADILPGEMGKQCLSYLLLNDRLQSWLQTTADILSHDLQLQSLKWDHQWIRNTGLAGLGWAGLGSSVRGLCEIAARVTQAAVT